MNSPADFVLPWRLLPHLRGALRACAAIGTIGTFGCHSSFQPFPDALACAGASGRTIGVESDSAGIAFLGNLNDVVWYGWSGGIKRWYVTYHGSTSGDSLPSGVVPRGINASGVVVASSATGPLLYDHGVVTRITAPANWSVLAPTPVTGTAAWTPIAINDSGYVAMSSTATSGRAVVLFWRSGSAATGTSWTTAATPVAVTIANSVVTVRASLLAGGGGSLYEVLGTDGTTRAFDGATSFAINDLGQVAYGSASGAGTLVTATGATQAVPFTPTALNNALQMVGMSAGIPMYGIGSRSVRLDHALDDLHLTIVSAVAINNNGTIAANVSNGTSGHGVGLLFNASACTIK